MNWKNINLLPKELINKAVLLYIIPCNGGDDIYVMGEVDEDGYVYTDTQYDSGVKGYLPPNFAKEIFFINPREIKQ